MAQPTSSSSSRTHTYSSPNFSNSGGQKTVPYLPDSPVQSAQGSRFLSIYSSPVVNHSNHALIQSDLPEGVIEKIMDNLKDAFNKYRLSIPAFNGLYEDAKNRNDWIYRESTYTSPGYYLGPKVIYVEDGKLYKEGGESCVKSVVKVCLTEAIPNIPMVVKIPLRVAYFASSQFSPETKLMSAIQNKNPQLLRRFDAIVERHLIKVGNKIKDCAFFYKSEMDFSDIKDLEFSPLILWRLVDIARAIKDLHDQNMVHNDLKESNFLFNGLEKVAKLTDFGCMKQIQKDAEPHSTSTTPFYADPSAWENWEAQLQYRGNQKNPDSDVRSFGKCLFYDFVCKRLDATTKTIPNSNDEHTVNLRKRICDVRKQIKPLTPQFQLPEGRQAIADLDRAYPRRVIFYRETIYSTVIKTYHFPDVLDSLQSTLEWIELIKDRMSEGEVIALREIAILSCRMQSMDIDELPTMEYVVRALSDIAGDPENDVAGTPYLQKHKQSDAQYVPVQDSPYQQKQNKRQLSFNADQGSLSLKKVKRETVDQLTENASFNPVVQFEPLDFSVKTKIFDQSSMDDEFMFFEPLTKSKF